MTDLDRILLALDGAVTSALDAASSLSEEPCPDHPVTQAIMAGVHALHYAQDVALRHCGGLAVVPTEV